nr:GtrA family protein [Spirochaetia bacterium]
MKKGKYIKKIFFQFIRFNIIGVINTTITYGIFSIVFYFTDSRLFSLLINYLVGINISFFANRYYTFRIRNKEIKHQFIRMVASYGIIFVLN